MLYQVSLIDVPVIENQNIGKFFRQLFKISRLPVNSVMNPRMTATGLNITPNGADVIYHQMRRDGFIRYG